MKPIKLSALFIAITGILFFNPAFAHHAMGGNLPFTFIQGLISGLAHPVIGVDHLAFLVMVALLCVPLNATLRLVVPLAFVSATLMGTLTHMTAVNFPMNEALVALSVIVAGTLVLLKRDLPGLMLVAGVSLFGIIHGYALGESIIGAETSPLVAYLIGFMIIEYLVIAGATHAVRLLALKSLSKSERMTRIAGVAGTLTGVYFLAANLA